MAAASSHALSLSFAHKQCPTPTYCPGPAKTNAPSSSVGGVPALYAALYAACEHWCVVLVRNDSGMPTAAACNKITRRGGGVKSICTHPVAVLLLAGPFTHASLYECSQTLWAALMTVFTPCRAHRAGLISNATSQVGLIAAPVICKLACSCLEFLTLPPATMQPPAMPKTAQLQAWGTSFRPAHLGIVGAVKGRVRAPIAH